MKLSYKIFLYFGTFTLLIILIFFTVNYYVIQRSLHQRAQKDLHQLVESTNTAVENMLDTAIRNYLRGVVEQDIAVLNQLQDKVLRGTITELKAKDAFQIHAGNQKIGKNGYIVALNPQGSSIILDIHPFLRGRDCASNQGCQDWISQKNGYSEYEWQNPKDKKFRKKVSYIIYFEPWDWVVGATSYKDEFIQLVKIDDLKRFISSFTILDQGYFFVLDDKLTFLIHPELEGTSGQDMQDIDGRFVAREMLENLGTFIYYRWKNPSEEKAKKKFAYAKKLDNFNWYLVATGYMEDVTLPINRLMHLSYTLIILVAILLTVLILFFSRNLSRPLDELIKGLQAFYQDKKIFKMHSKSVVEIEAVGHSIENMTKILVNAEQEKKDLLELLDNIINSMPSILICIDINEKIILWNDKATEYSGFSRAEALHQTLSNVFPEFIGVLDHMKESIKSQAYYSDTCQIQREQGADLHYAITIYPLHSGLQSAVIRIDDISEQVHMKNVLLQRHKMESIGTLAGGIAHDFNNILSGIFGFSQLAKNHLKEPERAEKDIEQVIKGAQKATELVQQILAVSRKTVHKKQPLSIRIIIKEAVKLLRATIPATIQIMETIASEATVMADPTKIHQVVMNLCTNAYHSMLETGGLLTIYLNEVEFKHEDIIPGLDIEPGKFLKLEISDTGHGMEPTVIEKIFEPYFSTKDPDKGTGLGLAVVFAIVQEHKGHITVYSEPGQGSTFHIYLPIIDEPVATLVPKKEEKTTLSGEETIMFVDDEEALREVTHNILKEFGYTVHAFSSGTKAFETYSEDPYRFDLVITDMTMPGMTGLELSQKILKLRPEQPVMLCTGYSESINREKAVSMGISGYFEKPMITKELAKVIRDLLDDAKGKSCA